MGTRVHPVILCGGSGTRLWPLSRDAYPKQFLPLTSDKSMLRETLRRVYSISGLERPILVSLEDHRFLVVEECSKEGIEPEAIILEPIGKNTLPAITMAALYLKQRYQDQNTIMLVFPADHILDNINSFTEAMQRAIDKAKKRHMVLLGIKPHRPETGYGYIKRGRNLDGDPYCFLVDSFTEKPSLEKAQEFLKDGNYYWNSGMFVFDTDVILEETQKYAPDILENCSKTWKDLKKDLKFIKFDPEAFNKIRSESIDYAVIEKTERLVLIPLEAGWSDIGSWKALYDFGKKDSDNNILVGDILTKDTHNSYIRSNNRLVATLGVDNTIIIDTDDALLVASMDRSQQIKDLVNTLKGMGREECKTHVEVYRPWGSYRTIAKGDRFLVKKIVVKPQAELSYQMHYHRAEHWIVVKGTALVIRDGQEIIVREDESIYIPIGVKHRLKNPGLIPLELIEVQTGSYLAEDDIIRFDDIYGRN